MPSPNEITPTQLNRLIGTPAAPDLIDLRIDDDFDDDPRLIPGAFRHARTDLEVLLPQLGSRPVVVYCQKGRKMSRWSQRNFLQHRLMLRTCSSAIAARCAASIRFWPSLIWRSRLSIRWRQLCAVPIPIDMTLHQRRRAYSHFRLVYRVCTAMILNSLRRE